MSTLITVAVAFLQMLDDEVHEECRLLLVGHTGQL